MKQDKYNLQRSIKVQDSIYVIVLKELKEGNKHSYWMWYIFPQLKQLGYSFNSKFYGISGLEEANAYLQNSIPNQRLRTVSNAILNLSTNNAVEVFGGIDSPKLCSSMTLFDMLTDHYVNSVDQVERITGLDFSLNYQII